MANVALVRLDSRLIHGQVAANALKRCGAKRIIIIDNAVAADAFQAQVLKYVCPPGVTLDIMTTSQAGKEYHDNAFGPQGPILALFGNVQAANDAYYSGFQFSDLQIGGLRDTTCGRKNVHGQIYLNEAEANMLQEMKDKGVNVFIQEVPEGKIISWDAVYKKHFT